MLMTMTVIMIEAMTKTMVNSMYFPMRGTALEVDGMSSTITSKKTVRDSKTEMDRVIFSPVGVDETQQDIQLGSNHTAIEAKLLLLELPLFSAVPLLSRLEHFKKKCLFHESILTGICWQVEDQSSEEGEEHAGNNDVDDEVQRQPLHQEVVGDV